MGDFDPRVQKNGFDKIMKTGLQVHLILPLKSGSYTLRIGVADRKSGIIGTMGVPLTVPAVTTATSSTPAKPN
jgi:hypothetical protein